MLTTNKLSRKCGIFAAAAVMTSTFFFTACNCDDDFDFGPDKQYTLADRMMTRGGEPESTIPYASNACGLWSIMTMLGNPNSEFFYNYVYASATKLGWEENSGIGLTTSQIIDICNSLRSNPDLASYSNKLEKLPSEYNSDPNTSQGILREKSEDTNYNKKISVGVLINDKVINPETGDYELKKIKHWVVFKSIDGQSVKVANTYQGAESYIRTSFNLNEIQAICY